VGEDDDDVLNDDDIRKISRLQLINASARFELLSANQQLIDFHLNRVMKKMLNRKNREHKDNNSAEENINNNSSRRAAWKESSGAAGLGHGIVVESGEIRLNTILSKEKEVIDEVSEAEENNIT